MKKTILLLFCILTLSWSSAYAEYGYGTCTLLFNEYESNNHTINSPFSITFDDPNITLSINGKKYSYFIEPLTLALDDYIMFYTSTDKKNYIGLTTIDEKIYLLISTPELKITATSNSCNEPSKLSSFYKDVKYLFRPQIKITGYYFPVFTDQKIILAYKYKIINGKNRMFRRILTINDEDNSNVVGSIDPDDIILEPESNNEEETIREPIDLTDYEFRSYERPGVMGLSNGRHLLNIRLSIVDKEHSNNGDQVVVDIPVVVENGKVKNPTHREWNW